MSNVEIAKRNYVSVKTVDHQVSSILAKLRVRGRGDIARETIRLAWCRSSRPPRERASNPYGWLVSEVPHAGQHHRYLVLRRRCENFLVAHRAAGLDDRRDPSARRGIHPIAEREERV